MGARQKLNGFYTCCGVIIAGIVGTIIESWVVFFITIALMLGSAVVDGSIRPTKRHR